MNEKSFKSCLKFHRLGKLKFFPIMLLSCIIVGNISEQIVNIITNNMIILTPREIISPTVFWIVYGICLGIYSWKSNEKEYNNYVKLKKC